MATKVRVPKRRFLVTVESNGKKVEFVRSAYSGAQAMFLVKKEERTRRGLVDGAYVGHMEAFELD